MADADYHFRPHYREQTPVEPLLENRHASGDKFPAEQEYERLAPILAEWTAGLCQAIPRSSAIEKSFGVDFLGCSLHPLSSHRLRHDNVLTISRLSFAPEAKLHTHAFASELQQYLSDFAHVTTAEFQVTHISVGTGKELKTRLRYELSGTGTSFHREGRVGELELSWAESSSGEYKVRNWQQGTETRSRTSTPVYEDLTAHAFTSNHSYSAQLLHGVDYWRTVLDGACGIDIYGHNGVSVGDVHGIGRDDLYVCQPAGLPNRLYRNRGDGTFEDITELSGVGLLDNTACALFADIDNDGRQDLIVVRANGPLLFLNEGSGRFRQKSDAFQFASPPQGTFTGAAIADYDRDGWLDIYFCLYTYYQGAGQYRYPTPYYDANNGPPNFLLRNNRDGSFRDVTVGTGLNRNNTRYSFCCGWTDIDQNGWPDLYVVNDFGRKNLYRNNGDGTFTDIADQAGVADVGAGMSVCAFDYNNKGVQDLYVADMWTAAGERITSEESFKSTSSSASRALYHKHAMGNSLFQNKSAGVFEDRSAAAGVGVGRWSWSSDTWDFDHDGFPDVYIANGMISGPIHEDLNSFFWREVVANSPDEPGWSQAYEQGWTAVNELIRQDYSWSGFERNILYANNGDGTFADVSGALGLDFVEDGRAFALADFDGDGRLEVLLKNRNAPQIRLLKNVIEDLPPSLCFSLRGTKSNRDAIGAAITITTERGRQTRSLQAGSGFLSQHSKQIFFGLGRTKGPVHASILWPSGLVQPISGLLPDHRVFVQEGNAVIRMEPFDHQRGMTGNSSQQSGDVLPTVAATWMLIPMSAPEFTLTATNGDSRSLSEWHGRARLLYLWTGECARCRENLAILGRAHRTLSALGLELLTINFEGETALERTRELGREHQYAFPMLMASDDMGAVYNFLYGSLFDRHRDLSLPTSLLIDEQGDIVRI